MALHACPECGHQVSDQAGACPGCGAPTGAGRSVPASPSIEEWALSQLKAGLPRRQVVEEIVAQAGLDRSDADALAKRLESALVPERPAHLVKAAAAVGITGLLLLAVFVVMRLLV